jgi:hypothetical protein
MTPQEHTALLRAFEVDRLLKLLALEAKKHHDGHYAIFSFTTGYKVAFGTPAIAVGSGREQLGRVPACVTLKEALIAALVASKTFAEYGEEAVQHQERDDIVAGMLTFEQHGRPCCRGEVVWSHGGTSPIGFLCACGARFIFADWSPGSTRWQDDPIGQAIMHIHKVHHLPVETTFRMFQAFPQLGMKLAKQQAALAEARPD